MFENIDGVFFPDAEIMGYICEAINSDFPYMLKETINWYQESVLEELTLPL